jgi:hypothetical protein
MAGDFMALEPDGTATACKAVLSGFDSHLRLLVSIDAAFSSGARCPVLISGSWRRVFRQWFVQKLVSSEVSSEVRAPVQGTGCRGFDSRTDTAGCKPAPRGAKASHHVA